MRAGTLIIASLAVAGCAAAPPPAPQVAAAPPATAPSSASSAAPAAPAPPPRCGEIACELFDSPEQALERVLATKPVVVAVGETHAQRGTEHIPSTTKRFTEKLLPLLAGRASDLVLELWVADGACAEREAAVAEQQKPVTETQAEDNQNEFVTLGHRAQQLGIRPHVLRPSCEEYQLVMDAGDDAIVEMLTMIARLTATMVGAILERNQRDQQDKLVVAYGGIVHNDLAPRPGREAWSFGPTVRDHVAGRYVEIDLIVPEYIKDEPPWTALGWVPRFDRTIHADRVRLLSPQPGSYVLVFAETR